MAAVDVRLPFGEPLFERANRPTRIGFEHFEWRSTIDIFWTNIARFYDIARNVVIFFEPAQREALRAADVRTMIVNAAMVVVVEERASSGRMRLCRREQLGMMPANDRGLHFEDRHAVDTAVRAAGTTLKTRRIRPFDRDRDFVNNPMKRLDPVDCFIQ